MDEIMDIAERYGLLVIEDAAQGVMSSYKGKPLGSIGHMAALSFHETKNIISGEGGALLINNSSFIERAEIIREKGTNRSKFFRGEIDKYTWVDIGSSFLPSDIIAAFLYAQMEKAVEIIQKRMMIWNHYYEGLKPLADKGIIALPFIPVYCGHNAHIFYIKTADLKERIRLIQFLKEKGVSCVFHYVPLHSSEVGLKHGMFFGDDNYTTLEAEKLIRLPMFYELTSETLRETINCIYNFYL